MADADAGSSDPALPAEGLPTEALSTELLDRLDAVLEVVGEVSSAFASAGFGLYLVGGVVRDLVLGSFTASHDIDLTTDALPADIKRLIEPHASALWTQGERFGTIGANIGSQAIEITTHRAEAYDKESRKPVVTFGTDIGEDLTRRDFTINAIAISLPDRELLDPHGGLAHLRSRRLATPLAADVSFTDDPLRMLRAARFIARFNLAPDDGVTRSATALAERLQIVSVERIHDELERLLALPEPATGLEFLAETGLLAQAVPPLGPNGHSTAAVTMAGASGGVLVRRAGLLWPLGADGTRSALNQLRYSAEDTKATVALIDACGHTLTADPSDEMIRRVIAAIGLGSLPDLTQLCTNVRAVSAGLSGDDASPAPFFARLADLAAVEDLSDLTSPLKGGEVIAALQLEPGPIIGRSVAYLQERRLVQGPMSAAEAVDALRAWIELGTP